MQCVEQITDQKANKEDYSLELCYYFCCVIFQLIFSVHVSIKVA